MFMTFCQVIPSRFEDLKVAILFGRVPSVGAVAH